MAFLQFHHGGIAVPPHRNRSTFNQYSAGTGKNSRERRIVYQWSAKRITQDSRNINLMERKALAVAEGKAPLKRVRFLKVSGAEKELDEKVIERARMLAGFKGYDTNLSV